MAGTDGRISSHATDIDRLHTARVLYVPLGHTGAKLASRGASPVRLAAAARHTLKIDYRLASLARLHQDRLKLSVAQAPSLKFSPSGSEFPQRFNRMIECRGSLF
jgi:hypothetical protein